MMNVFHACARKHLFPGIFVAAACARIARRHARAVLRRAQALQRRRHPWPRPSGKYDGISEFVARARGRTWPSFKPNVLPVSITGASIEVSGQWLFEKARHSSDTDV